MELYLPPKPETKGFRDKNGRLLKGVYKNPMRGKKLKPEHAERIKKSQFKKGNEMWKKREKSVNIKKYDNLNLCKIGGEYIDSFTGIREVAEFIGVSYGTVYKAITRRHGKVKNYIVKVVINE